MMYKRRLETIGKMPDKNELKDPVPLAPEL